MIDAAAQILTTINTARNSVDKSSGSQRNSQSGSFQNSQRTGTSFGEFYDKSRNEIEKKPEDLSLKRDQSKQSNASTEERNRNVNQKNNDGNSVKNRTDETSKTEKVNANSKANQSEASQSEVNESNANETAVSKEGKDVKNSENDSEAANLTSENVNESGVTKQFSVTEAQLAEDALAIVEDALQVEGDEIALDEADIINGIKVGHQLQESDSLNQKKGELAQAIVNEFKAAKDEQEKLDGPVLTRAEVLAGIEKALNKDKLIETTIPAHLLKPEVTANAAKVLAEQLKSKDLGLVAEESAEPEILLEGEGDELLDSTESTDALLEKIIERLDFGKLKNEAVLQSKAAMDKSTISEFVEQLSVKVTNESGAGAGLGSGSLISQVGGVAGRAGAVLPTPQFTMNTHINQPEWSTDFSKRIQFMINSDIKNAELRLDPPELGRINIKISMNQDQASVTFTSAHGNVRESIENSIPRLRELLSDAGIQLGDANINERQQQDTNHAEGDSRLAGPVFPGDEDDGDLADTPREVIEHSIDGVIDYFA